MTDLRCVWCNKVNLSRDWVPLCSEACWDAMDDDFQKNWQKYWNAGKKFITTNKENS